MELTNDELKLLLYIETRAVDFQGKLDIRHLRKKDIETLKKWDKNGFVQFGRISLRTQPEGSTSTNWAILSEAAWEAAHAERKNRAERMAQKRTWLTTAEARHA